MTTLRDQFERALRLKGLALVKTTPRYLVFRSFASDCNWYIGRRGSLRIGTTTTNSRVVSERTRQRLLAQYAAAQQKEIRPTA